MVKIKDRTPNAIAPTNAILFKIKSFFLVT